MRAIPCLPTSTKARLALAGGLTVIYIMVSTVYLGYGGSAFPMLRTQPDDLGHSTEASTAPENTPAVTVNQSRILLVSAFFPLNTSKITDAEYDMWLTNYLGTVGGDIYMYTSPEQAERVRALRAPGAPLYLDTNFTTIFDIPPLKGKEDVYTRNRKKDRSRPRHSIEAYAAINAKPYLLHAAVRAMPTKYAYAFWTDATSFHHPHEYRAWPAPARVDELWEAGGKQAGTPATDLLFVPTWGLPHSTMAYWQEGMGPLDAKFTEGSFFGGAPAAVDWWARTFYAYHDAFLGQELFIGKDQSIFNALATLFAKRVITVWYNDPAAPAHVELQRKPEQSFLGQCDSEWFYYQFFLADAETRQAMRAKWIAAARRWRWWGWWNARDTEPCRDTRVLDMVTVLKTQFGDSWHSPAASVNVPQKINWTLG